MAMIGLSVWVLSLYVAFFGTWAIARGVVTVLHRREARRRAIPKTPVALWGKKGGKNYGFYQSSIVATTRERGDLRPRS